MNALVQTSVLAAVLLATAAATVSQATAGDQLLDELRKSGSIVTTHGIAGR